jgi:hypothetical protein
MMPGGPPKRSATCHPDRKHHAKGYCSSCYRVKSRRPENNPVRATCHPNRPHHAIGLCGSCYTKHKNGKNPEKVVEWTRAATLRVYGLTPEKYDEIYRAQEGLCAICKNPPKVGQPLSVDHNHGTMVVRGLLCDACNNGISRFKENPDVIRAAAKYLEAPPLNIPIPMFQESGASGAVN